MEYLFVYGTLRRACAHPLHRLLAEQARYEGMATYEGCLYDLGAYPGAVPHPGAAPSVLGELYALPAPQTVLPQVDRYEGCTERYDPRAEYRRERQAITREDGTVVTAWIYLYNRPTGTLRLIESGDFLRRHASDSEAPA